ncbi:unnamed protein product [Cladocopium goreaui]|uniref:PDZ domain-containing protein n=1 Tax=Cladocopium goreaui TaxID=2562237 RepID=A0A9P1DUP0_9DINO|nr:unnamed protein product [Cladocopium goreaui]|mmetsp:Transcript_58837/g.128829  ORF Transcript_58837/g.128829 Transcript_58837/m.128829 type:complete len:215 (+) Transcript_58837:52-696(+)
MLCCCVDEKPAEFVELQTDSAFPEGKGGSKEAKEDGDTFEVSLERKPGTYFGVDLSSAGKACIVTSVTSDGLVAEWNNSGVAPRCQVQKYDRLLAVNGQTSEKSKEVLDMLKHTHDQMVLTFQRARINEVKLQRDGKSLGIHLKDGPHFLLVLGVEDGVVKDYNKSVPHPFQVVSSDRIIAVDGFEGSGAALMDKVRGSDRELSLKVLAWRGSV